MKGKYERLCLNYTPILLLSFLNFGGLFPDNDSIQKKSIGLYFHVYLPIQASAEVYVVVYNLSRRVSAAHYIKATSFFHDLRCYLLP